jgi:hypothetical protein
MEWRSVRVGRLRGMGRRLVSPTGWRGRRGGLLERKGTGGLCVSGKSSLGLLVCGLCGLHRRSDGEQIARAMIGHNGDFVYCV